MSKNSHNHSYIFKINNNNLNLCNNILSFRIIYKTLCNTKRELITGFTYCNCGLISKTDFDYIISRDDLIKSLNTDDYNLLIENIDNYKKKYINMELLSLRILKNKLFNLLKILIIIDGVKITSIHLEKLIKIKDVIILKTRVFNHMVVNYLIKLLII